MKHIFIIFALALLASTILIGQNAQYQEYQGLNTDTLHTYGDNTNFPDSLIADDYGPRQRDANTPYDWHGGIDYNSPGWTDKQDEGDIINSIEAGIVDPTSNINTPGFKWITIKGAHNIVYEHVVKDGNIGGVGLLVGGCRVKHIDTTGNPNIKPTDRNNWAIIFHINGVYTAIGPINGSKVTFIDEKGSSRTITVTNTVAKGAPVAPLGGSGGFVPHAHIQGMSALTNANGNVISPGSSVGDIFAKNPLEYITHVSPVLDIVVKQDNIATGIKPVYPGDKKTPLSVKIKLTGEADGKRYKNSVVDIEKIEFKIANSGQNNWRNIQGPSASNKIQYGGRGNDPVLPGVLRTQGIGNWNRTGVEPRTYWNHNYDDYFFAEFYARIHSRDSTLFARYPWDARYKDGNHQIKVAVTNVNDAFPDNWSVPNYFQIDNFNPFVYYVSCYFSNGPVSNGMLEPFYSCSWEVGSNGVVNLGARSNRGVPDANNPGALTISVKTSEAMTSMQARVPDLFPNWVNGNNNYTLPDGKQDWSFYMGVSNAIASNQCYLIEIDGYDINGNRILTTTLPADCAPHALSLTLPYRNSSTTWANPSPQGTDGAHFFNLTSCGHKPGIAGTSAGSDPAGTSVEECIKLHEVKTKVYYATPGNADGGVDVTIAGSHPNASYSWTNSSGNQVGTLPSLKNVPAGIYCLDINEGCCNVSGCYEINECNSELNHEKTNPTVADPNSGEIHLTVVNGYEPYTYKWSTGATTSDIVGLSAGTHCVTVKDFFRCTLVDCVTLVNCSPISLAVTKQETPPSGCGQSDGSIRIVSVTPSGGTAPFTYKLINSQGQEFFQDNTGRYNNLPSETYCFIVTDAMGCTGSVCGGLGLNLLTPLIDSHVVNPCVGQNNGSITYIAVTPNLDLFDFQWDNGFTTVENYESVNENLTPGTYCVTLTSLSNGCTLTDCINLTGQAAAIPLNITAFEKKPCPKAKDGYIDITVTGGVPPYSYVWSGVPSTPYTAQDAYDLPDRGNFTVTVTDFCGNTAVKAFSFQPFEIIIQSIPGCADLGELHASVVGGGNAPYKWLWKSDQGKLTWAEKVLPDLDSLKSTLYCVTATDANLCNASKCVDLKNTEVTITKVGTCEQLAEGSATFHVSNPYEQGALIKFNNTVVYNNYSAPQEFDVSVTNLPSGEYGLFIELGNCTQPASQTTVKINKTSYGTEYVSYNSEDEICTYQNFCGGQEIPNSFTTAQPTYGLDNIDHGAFFCKYPIFCQNEEVGRKKVRNQTIRSGQYKILLKSWPLSTEVIAALDARLGDDCKWVKFCPIDMEIRSQWGDGGNEPDPMVATGDGCYILRCGAFGLINSGFCLDDLYDDLGLDDLPNGELITSCNATTATLKELIETHLLLKAINTTYAASELAAWVESNITSSVAACARVRYCTSDYSIIDLPDLDAIPSCEDYHFIFNIPSDNTGGTQWEWNDTPIAPLPTAPLPIQINSCQPLPQLQIPSGSSPCEITVCINPASSEIVYYDDNDIPVFGHLVYDCNPGEPGVTGPGDDTKFAANPHIGNTFVNFGSVFFQGESQPKGVISDGIKSYYMDYNTWGNTDKLHDLPLNTQFFIDDWDNGQLVWITQNTHNNYSVKSESALPIREWNIEIKSTIISTRFFEKVDSLYLIGGTFQGNLSVGGVNVAESNNLSAYIVRISPNGIILGVSTVNGIDTNSEVGFSRTESRVNMSVVSGASNIKVNGSTIATNSGSIVNLSSDNLITSVINNPINIGNGLKLLKSSQSKNDSLVTYLLRGNGTYSIGGQSYHLDGSNDYLLVTINQNNTLLWAERFPVEKIVSGQIDICYAGNNLSLTATFKDTIQIQSQSFISLGGSDIVILIFNNHGTISHSDHYGTIQDEHVSNVLYGNERLYFAGAFGGNISYRAIGKHNYLTLSNSMSNPYISYIDAPQSKAFKSIADRSFTERNLHLNMSKASVYPNPFNDHLYLGLTAEEGEQYEVRLFNSVGNLINEKRFISVKGRMEIDITSGQNLPLGIYFVTLVSNTHSTKQFKVIRSK